MRRSYDLETRSQTGVGRFDGEEPDDTPIYDRSGFVPGMALNGPAVIDQFDATVLVFPGDAARVDDALNIVIDRARQRP